MAAARAGRIRSKISILSRIRSFPRYMADGAVSPLKKVLVLLLVAYILSPIDLVPEALIPLIGFLDDFGILTLLLGWMYSELGEYRQKKIAEKEGSGEVLELGGGEGT